MNTEQRVTLTMAIACSSTFYRPRCSHGHVLLLRLLFLVSLLVHNSNCVFHDGRFDGEDNEEGLLHLHHGVTTSQIVVSSLEVDSKHPQHHQQERLTVNRDHFPFGHSLESLKVDSKHAQHHQQERLNHDHLPFGHSLISSGVFLLNYTNFNHGSFGACPRHVLQNQLLLRVQQEQQPDLFLRKSYKQYWNTTRSIVAEMWDTSYKNILLLESASAAMNSILRSFESFVNKDATNDVRRNQDDNEKYDDRNRAPTPILIQFSTSYGMVKNTNEWLHRHYGIEVVTVPIQFPIHDDVGDDAYLQPLNRTLRNLQQQNQLHRLKVVVIDHIVSIPAVKLPVVDMAKLVRSYSQSLPSKQHNDSADDVFIVVDGAHAMGQVQRKDISTLLNSKYCRHRRFNGDSATVNAADNIDRGVEQDDDRCCDDKNYLIDAYLSNGHKWMYAPKGSAVLWVNPSRITPNFPEPTVISSENSFDPTTISTTITTTTIEDDPLYHRYVYTSTKDYTSIVSLGTAIDFYDNMLGGEDHIYNYTRSLALQAKQYLIETWKTKSIAPDDMEVFMFHVVLPPLLRGKGSNNNDKTHEIGMTSDVEKAKELQQWLYDKKNMYVVIAQEPTSGLFYTRLSSQVYLQIDDFVRLGDAVLEFLNKK